MIVGIGTDIIEIERIKNAVKKNGRNFLARIFTEREIAYCYLKKDPFPSLAARFAAKEAVFKALGCGLTGCKWTDAEVFRRENHAPEIVLGGNLSLIAEGLKVCNVLISISHDKGRATAFAIAVTSEEGVWHEGC
ncbi:MAG: holo-ACP synthase [Peptococcaceae bacterium]|nr:holo-ACP synthase [Peptococcaceae bacterium]